MRAARLPSSPAVAAALLLLTAAGLAAAAPCEKKGPYELKGPGGYEKARAEAFSACMSKIESLGNSYEYVKPCSSACGGGAYMTLDAFKGGSGGSFEAAYQCCLEIGPAKGTGGGGNGNNGGQQQQQQQQSTPPKSTGSPTPQAAPAGPPGLKAEIAAALGGWSGNYSCDVAGAGYFGRNSQLAMRVVIRYKDGQVQISSKEQVISYRCRYEWDGVCEESFVEGCPAGTKAAMFCRVKNHPVWDKVCGDLVTVHEAEHLKLCLAGNKIMPIDVHPSCERSIGELTRSK